MNDDKNREILNLLLQDSRLSCSQIAESIGIDRRSVAKRIKKLEEGGLIEKYTIDVSYTKIGYTIKKLHFVRYKNLDEETILKLRNWIKANENIIYAFSCTGKWDAAYLMLYKNIDEVEEQNIQFRSLFKDNIADTDSIFLLKNYQGP